MRIPLRVLRGVEQQERTCRRSAQAVELDGDELRYREGEKKKCSCNE